MSYTKGQLIEILTPALINGTGSSQKDVHSVLETYDTERLTVELARQRKAGLVFQRAPIEGPEQVVNDPEIIRQVQAIRAEVQTRFENDPERIRRRQEDERQAQEIYREYSLSQIFRTVVPGHGVPVRNKASEDIVIGWLSFDEKLSREWFLKVLQENPSLASQFQWQSPDALDPKKRLAQDQGTLAQAARTLRSFGVNEANLTVVRSVIGSGFTVYAIQQALASNALQLSGPSQSELDQWAEEDIEAHNQRLLQADPTTLRLLARQESADKRVQEQAQRVNEQFEATKRRDEAIGYPQLPSEITKDQIRNAPTDKLKLWIKKYGNANVTARLQGRG